MYNEAKIGVVVPCYNEELLILRVIETMPHFVDRIYVVDDCSTDNTTQVVEEYPNPDHKVILIKHATNKGVGAAITTGYIQAAEDGIDVVAVMAGDAQMDPNDLEDIILPVVSKEVDYTKGNRLSAGDAWETIPRIRYLGNVALSLMTKISSGYWHLFDSQTGYTAISKRAIERINWKNIWNGYGYPNDLLIKLSIANFKVKDVPIRPVYGVGEVSGIKISKVIFIISRILFKGFFERLFFKFIIRDTHPLVLFYGLGLLLLPLGFLFGTWLVFYRLFIGNVAATSALMAVFLTLFGTNFLMFALWFDMDYHRDLR